MTWVYLKSICVVNTPVFCCFKKAFLDPLKAEEKAVRMETISEYRTRGLGILLKATLPTKMPFYFPSLPSLTNTARAYLEFLSYNLTKKLCYKCNGNYSMNANSQKKTSLREMQTVFILLLGF